jgi:hypothetical protein
MNTKLALLGGSLLAAGACLAMPAFAKDVSLQMLSSNADLVSGDTALVRIAGSTKKLSKAVVRLNGTDVTTAFRADGAGNLVALVGGLRRGANELALFENAKERKPADVLTLTNHAISGPVFSGPHQTPFVCETAALGLGAPLDADCTATPRVDYYYRSSVTNAFKPLDVAAPRPADVATTTTTDGKTVPYIVRREMGTINRAIFVMAVLHAPGTPLPDPWTKTDGWNGRLVYSFGGGVRAGFHQGSSVGGLAANTFNLEHTLFSHHHLERGFALAAGSLNVYGTNASDLISAETMLMIKEQFSKKFGVPRYTIGMGESGGSMQQHTIANNYPGSLDGIIPGRSYPDAMSFLQPLFECELMVKAIGTSALPWTTAQKTSASGMNTFTYCISNGTRYPNMRPTNCAPVIPAGLVYNAATNPGGARCTFQDNLVNVFGIDPATGFARRPFDNVGVQYGLKSYNAGLITFDQFVDLNTRIGGFDVDGNIVASRTTGNPEALRIAYRTGRMNDGTSLDAVPMIDVRSYVDADYADGTADVHNAYHSRTMRMRLIAANGHARNQVILTGETLGTLGLDQANATSPLRVIQREALDLMDQWLMNVANDASDRSKAQKVARNKPASLVDACFTVAGEKITDAAVCAQRFPYGAEPRLAAGAPLTADIFKCALKPVTARDYAGTVTAAQLATLRSVFPSGVCNWSKPGVAEQDRIGTWLSYPGFGEVAFTACSDRSRGEDEDEEGEDEGNGACAPTLD